MSLPQCGWFLYRAFFATIQLELTIMFVVLTGHHTAPIEKTGPSKGDNKGGPAKYRG